MGYHGIFSTGITAVFIIIWKLIVVFVKYSLLETSQVGSLEVGHSV